jgi:hypothetical protein
MKLKNLLAVLLAAIWISLSEFFRNEVLMKSFWVGHYQKLGLIFPSGAVNGMMWGIWSLMFSVAIFNIAKKFSLAETSLLSWFVAFPMMWLVLGNLSVLPHNLMMFATPLTLLESFVAALIIKKVSDIQIE